MTARHTVDDAGAPVRAAAALAISLVLGPGRTLESALADARVQRLGKGSPAATQALAYGALRFGLRLVAATAGLLARPWDQQSPELRGLLLLGLYQLEYGDVPPHAAVNTVVDAAKLLGQGKSSGFVNAVLRRYQRERDVLLARADATLADRTAHPQWLVNSLERDWAGAVPALLEANNERPPLWLRVNRRRISLASLTSRLEAAGHVVTHSPFAIDALRLEVPVDVRHLPEFAEGLCSVQDAAAQLAVPFLGAAAGDRVLDACAAPGGKTCHLLEAAPELSALIAVESDGTRATRITSNLSRLGLEASVRVADATRPEDWWDGVPFARILLDVPCSGTGVIRRHPDIKWLRRPNDIPTLATRQRRLLGALWPLLAPGGRLLYVSCSVLRAENADLIAGFLAGGHGAVDMTESVRLSIPDLPPPGGAGPGYALLPGATDTDGFFYACLDKR